MLKPSRRARFSMLGSTSAFGQNNCNLNINTFYRAPIGQENWSVKHIEPEAANIAALKNKQSKGINNSTIKPNRLPIMKATVKAAPIRYTSNVIRNHHRTQDRLRETSKRAGREHYLS